LALQGIADAIWNLRKSIKAVKNNATQGFCCHKLYIKLQKTARLVRGLGLAAENINSIDVQKFDIQYGSRAASIFEIGNSIELINDTFVTLFTKYNSIPAASFEIFCQSREIIPYIDAINEILQTRVYPVVSNFFLEYGVVIPPFEEESGGGALQYEDILSSMHSSYVNINAVFRGFAEAISGMAINTSPSSDLLASLSSFISAINGVSGNMQMLGYMIKEKSLCRNRDLFDYSFEKELIRDIWAENNTLVNTFIKILNTFARRQGIERAHCVGEILELFRKFVKMVEAIALLDDPLLFKSGAFERILEIWGRYTAKIADLLGSEHEAMYDLLLTESFNLLFKETLDTLPLLGGSELDFGAEEGRGHAYTAELYKQNIHAIKEQASALAEAFTWLADEIAFVRPDFSEEAYSLVIDLGNGIERVYYALAPENSDSLKALAQAVLLLRQSFEDTISGVRRPQCDLALITAINNIAAKIREIAGNIEQIKDITEGNDDTKTQYKNAVITFLHSIVLLEQFIKDLRNVPADSFAEILSHTPFDEMLLAASNIWAGDVSVAPDLTPKATTIYSALNNLSLAVILLIRGVAKWLPHIPPTHEFLELTLLADPGLDERILSLPLYTFETDVNIAAIPYTISSFKTLHEVSQHLLAIFNVLFNFLQTIDKQNLFGGLLDSVEKITTTEDGQNVIDLLYRTKFNPAGLPVIDWRGRSLTEKDTFLQQTKIVSNFGALLDQALFLGLCF
jgi:hypothetical protein